jgi:hypothetical protein
MKKLPLEQRKVSTTVALSQLALGKLEIMSDRMQDSRSGIVEAAIGLYYRFYQVYGPDRADWEDDNPQAPDIPDDVSEIR